MCDSAGSGDSDSRKYIMPDDPIAQWKADNPWCETVGLVALSAAQMRALIGLLKWVMDTGLVDGDLARAGIVLSESYREIERQTSWSDLIGD